MPVTALRQPTLWRRFQLVMIPVQLNINRETAVNARDAGGATPLKLASAKGHTRTLVKLREAGAR